MKEVISDRQGIIILILFVLGSIVIIGTGSEAKQDMWIALLLGLLISLPVAFIYGRLLTLFPEKNLYEIFEIIFGKVMGKLFSLLYIWFSLHLGSMVLFNFTSFIDVVALSQTPRIIPSACFMILCVYGVKQGIEVIGRWGEFFVTVLMIISVTIILLSIGDFKLDNIRPVLANGFKPIFRGALAVFFFPLSETILFTNIFSSLQKKASYYKVYIIGLTIGILWILAVSVKNILVLGPYLMSLNYFTTYVAVARISIGEFLQRIEILVSVAFLISGFVKISVCLLSAAKGISKVLNTSDYRFIVVPAALVILNLSFYVYEDIMETQNFVSKVYPYYAALINVIVPVIVLVAAEIKVRNKK